MIRIIPASRRHCSDFGWLKTYWLFSFDQYYDPENVRFGALRVFNDDLVAPQGGFPMHFHEEMEIVTIVLHGEVTHSDSMGNRTMIRGGEVQRMSAGTGVRHSEFNLADQPLHLYQIWVLPNRRGLIPGYEQKSFPAAARKNRLLPVASGRHDPDAVGIHADVAICLADFDAAYDQDYAPGAGRGVFVYLRSGALEINGLRLERNDQARIDAEPSLRLKALENARFVLIDVPV